MNTMLQDFVMSEGEQDGLKVRVANVWGGLQWRFVNKKGEYLSVILHTGSYGRENGLFEIMPPKAPKSWGDSVKGNLTFGEVQKWIDRLRREE